LAQTNAKGGLKIRGHVTRDFSSSNSRFSIADNPNVVYRIVANSRLKGNVDIAGPPPRTGTLHAVR
jgi:hypothetical protein